MLFGFSRIRVQLGVVTFVFLMIRSKQAKMSFVTTILKKSRLSHPHTVDAVIRFRRPQHGTWASFLFCSFFCCMVQAGVRLEVLCAAGLAASDVSV